MFRWWSPKRVWKVNLKAALLRPSLKDSDELHTKPQEQLQKDDSLSLCQNVMEKIVLPVGMLKQDWPARTTLFSQYIPLISALATQMALLGFIFPLFIYPGTCHLMVEDYSGACQRERER